MENIKKKSLRNNVAGAKQETHSYIYPLVGAGALLLLALGGCRNHGTPEGNTPMLDERVLATAVDSNMGWEGRHKQFALSDQLVLKIPVSFLGAPARTKAANDKYLANDNVRAELATFEMLLPSFEGYRGQRGVNSLKIDVQQIRSLSKEKAQFFTKERFSKNIEDSILTGQLTKQVTNKFGLDFYKWANSETYECFKVNENGDLLHLSLFLESSGRTRLFVNAFTKRYGGTQVQWSTDAANLEQWSEIDRHIWDFIEKWNVAPAVTSEIKPQNK